MKKLIALLLSLTLITALSAGCGSTANNNDAASPAPSDESAAKTSNIDKALALIDSFASGDTSVALENLTEGYIQHNLAYGTGRDAFIGSVEYLASAEVPTTVNNIRSFEDENYVFLQTIYNFAGAGEQVAFDIFRFEDGKIAEHWDVMETIADQSAWANDNGKF